MSSSAPSGASTGQLTGGANLAAVDPAWQPWLRLLELALGEASDVAWTAMVPSPVDRPPDAPLLHGTTFRLDPRRTRNHVRQLADVVGFEGVNRIDATALVRAAIARDDDALSGLAERAGAPFDTMAVLGQLAAVPLLHACARVLGAQVPRSWQHGWCPVCGAWASLVEMRGIERGRRLRCGCCASDWSFPVLRCAFCDEADHRKLGSLVPEGEEQLRRVETCESCKGYLKVVTTLTALPPHVLALHDVATVALDLAAHDRGYSRPARPAWAPTITLA